MVPGASDDAILDAAGSAFTVTSRRNETVDSLQLAANATLSLTGKTFTATADTGMGANAGIVLVGAGATLVAWRARSAARAAPSSAGEPWITRTLILASCHGSPP